MSNPVAILDRLAGRMAQRCPGEADTMLARMAVLDTSACIIAGGSAPQSEALRRMQAASATAGAGAVSLRLAVAAHALDFDDYEEPASTHPSAVLVPAIMALAANRSVTLADALAAWVAGYETILALGKALGYGHYMAGWHSTSTVTGIGAAVACARLLGLDGAGIATAASIAMSQSAGLKSQFGTDAKALHAGLAARCGLEAALLAQAGMTASPAAGDGPTGWLALYGTGDSPGWSALESGWPEAGDHPPFIKASPSCGYTLRPVDAALAIAESDGFDPAAIKAISIRIPAPYFEVARFRAPADGHEARFSASWCVACALADAQVAPAHFEPKCLARADLRALEALVDIDTYPLPPGAGDMSPAAPDTVAVTLAAGTRFEQTVAVPRGGPGLPFTAGELIGKYVTCGGRAADAEAFLAAAPATAFADPALAAVTRPLEI